MDVYKRVLISWSASLFAIAIVCVWLTLNVLVPYYEAGKDLQRISAERDFQKHYAEKQAKAWAASITAQSDRLHQQLRAITPPPPPVQLAPSFSIEPTPLQQVQPGQRQPDANDGLPPGMSRKVR